LRRLNPWGHHVSTAALAPVLLFQGHRARRLALTLPEAAGRRFGRCGEGPPLKVLILADCDFLKIDFFDSADQLEVDGFHPGPKAYSVWGKLAAALIA
jgi:hypothetical protein